MLTTDVADVTECPPTTRAVLKLRAEGIVVGVAAAELEKASLLLVPLPPISWSTSE